MTNDEIIAVGKALPRIAHAESLGGRKVLVTWRNGETKMVDLEPAPCQPSRLHTAARRRCAVPDGSRQRTWRRHRVGWRHRLLCALARTPAAPGLQQRGLS